MPLVQISLTLSCHFYPSFITSDRFSGLHPVSSHSCCMYVRAGRPAFSWSYVGVHKSTSLMSLSLLLQQCPVCLVHLTWIVFVMEGRWPYSWCLVGCCCQDLFVLFNQTYSYRHVNRFLLSHLPPDLESFHDLFSFILECQKKFFFHLNVMSTNTKSHYLFFSFCLIFLFCMMSHLLTS